LETLETIQEEWQTIQFSILFGGLNRLTMKSAKGSLK